MKLFGIYGAGGCGRGIMPLAREQLQGEADVELVFVDDRGKERQARPCSNGHRALSFDQFAAEPAGERQVALAVADSRLRAAVAERCFGAGIGFFSVWVFLMISLPTLPSIRFEQQTALLFICYVAVAFEWIRSK